MSAFTPGAELDGRVDAWLKAAGFTHADCGRWIFTWNAFRIECDLQSVIEALQPFDLDSIDLGSRYHDPEAREPAPLARKATGAGGATFVAVLAIDPDAVRRERAKSDIVVAEIARRQSPTFDQALRARAAESIAGTISITLETDASGRVRRRTKVTKVEIKEPDGSSTSQTVTETVERRPIPSSST